MADLSDVEIALTEQVVSALYPLGMLNDSILGKSCRIYRGWPNPSTLNADLAAGSGNATIFPAREADTVDYPYMNCEALTISSPDLSVHVNTGNVIFSGTVTPDLLAGVLVDNAPFIYQTVDGDTPASVAANLASQIRSTRPVVYSSISLSVPGATSLIARIQRPASLTQVSRRIRRDFHIALWCPNPSMRDVAAKAIDMIMSTKNFIELADRTACHIYYRSTQVYDQAQNANLYRRDLVYCCEYATTTKINAPLMMFGKLAQGGTYYV